MIKMDKTALEKIIACPVCHSKLKKKFLKAKDCRFSDFNSFLWQCRQCSLITLSPRPTKNQINGYYPDSYFVKDKKKIKKRSLVLSYLEILRLIDRNFSFSGRVLDLGCGKGDLLSILRDKGWQCFGREITKEGADFARKAHKLSGISQGDIEEADYPPKSFDLIILHHVLEHIYQPLKLIKKINSWLKDDGLLLIAVPNVRSLMTKIFKSKSLSLDIPRHLHQFSSRSLNFLLKKGGFRVVEESNFSLVHDEVTLLGSLEILFKLKPSMAAKIIFLPIVLSWLTLSYLINQGNTLIMTAKKTKN